MQHEIQPSGIVLPQAGIGALRAGASPVALFVLAGMASDVIDRAHGDWPVLTLELDIVRGCRTVQGIAARMVAAMRKAQPRGAYHLVASAAFGPLAYEIGLQLAGQDADVGLLALLGLDDAIGSDDGALLADALEEYERLPSPLRLDWIGAPAGARAWAGVTSPDRLAVHEARDRAEAGLQLARVLHAARQAPRNPVQRDAEALMTIQTGERGRAPWFCVPGAGASVVDFVPLAVALPSDDAVHGLQPRGMAGGLLPHSSVEAAAAAYLREVERVCPRGGLHLVGHSFGGWIAFEMARRLQARGRNVLSLTVLDSEVPGGFELHGPEYTRAEALAVLASLYGQIAQRPLDVRVEALRERSAPAQLQLLHGRLVEAGLMPVRSSPDALRGSARCFEAALRARFDPCDVYTGPARLALVQRTGETAEAAAQRYAVMVAGWRRWMPNLRFRQMAGNHLTLLKAPHVAHVADWLLEADAVRPAPRVALVESV